MVQPEKAPDCLVWRAAAHAGELHEAMTAARAAMACDDATSAPDVSWHEKRCCDRRLAQILVPRVRRWFPASAIDDAQAAKCELALQPLRRCSPAQTTALLHTWCDAWRTAARHGLGPAHCIVCGRQGADEVRHLVKCPRLRYPQLRASDRHHGRRRGGRNRSADFARGLTAARDVYHNLKSGRDETRPRCRPFGEATVRAVARHAWRRLGAL